MIIDGFEDSIQDKGGVVSVVDRELIRCVNFGSVSGI